MGAHYLQVQDRWAAGLGCDLGGAYLLARGLINRPAELTRLAGSYWGSNRYQALSVARNRLDAMAGVTGLLAGFGLQAVGYIASLASMHVIHTGRGPAVVAAAIALVAALLTICAGNLWRRFRLVPLLIEMSRYTMDDQKMPFPRAAFLPDWLEALGHERKPNEDDLAYAKRVAGVENLMTEDVDTQGSRTRLWTDPPLPPRPPPS